MKKDVRVLVIVSISQLEVVVAIFCFLKKM